MATRMLSCMSSKTLEEAMEKDNTNLKTPSTEQADTKDLRRMKSFTCQVLIHPTWPFAKNRVSSTQASTELKEEVLPKVKEDSVPSSRGWKAFISSLQCSKAPLRSTESLKEMATKLTAGAYKHSCKPCANSVIDQDASRAVHPETPPETNSETNFSLGPHHYRNATPPQKDDLGSNIGDTQSKNSSQFGSPTYASYHMSNGVAVKVPESPTNGIVNRLSAAGTGIPGTEWFSQVELGVFITFVTLSNGCNALKRIRFSRDIFSKKEAESWWAENGNRVRAIYNVPAFERTTTNHEHHTSSSEEEQASGVSGYATPAYSPQVSRGASMRDTIAGYNPGASPHGGGASLRDAAAANSSVREAASMRDAAASSLRETTSSVRDAGSVMSDSDQPARAQEREGNESEEGSERAYNAEETTWVEEDVPGVYLTLRNLAGGGRELKRVRFSREKFTEKQAKIWWDENRGRIHKQYL